MSDTAPKPEQRSREEIVNQIYKSRKKIDYGDEKEFSGYVLTYGSKQLTVLLTKRNIEITTYIANTKAEENKLLDETTLLFETGKKIMQDWTNEVGKPLRHVFTTENENLKEWAKHPEKGGKIFASDSVNERSTDIETPNDPALKKLLEKRMTFLEFIEPKKHE